MEFTQIKDIRGGMKNINCCFIVLEVIASTKTKENREVFSFKVADQTACINASIWDEPGKVIQAGDIIRLMKCYASLWRGSLTLYSGKNGEIQRIGDFCMIFSEQINMSEPILQNPNVPVATNGNGRTQPPITAPNNLNAVPPPETVKPPPKVSNSNNASRNFAHRKPPNKK